MSKFAIRLLTLAMFVDGAGRGARGQRTPRPIATRLRRLLRAKKAKKKTSEIQPQHRGCGILPRVIARPMPRSMTATTMPPRIEQLKALGHDDSAAVANLIGYSYRKLGDYKVSQIWYERALKADPNHVKTWQYYGLWQVEQGNRDQAQYHLNRIAALAGTRQRGISLARRGARKAARHRPGLLSSAIQVSRRKPSRLRRLCFVG